VVRRWGLARAGCGRCPHDQQRCTAARARTPSNIRWLAQCRAKTEASVVPAPRYLRPEHTIQAHQRAIERAIGLGWRGGCEAVTGRLEPAGAQVHTESRQAERSNQTKTAESHDCLKRTIVDPHNRTHRNHRNGRHPQLPEGQPRNASGLGGCRV